jgi:NADH-ubiquinone oxidoreductase B18 subunit (NDUFB7)
MAEFECKPPYDPPEMQVTQTELEAMRIPREYRDTCAHLLIPLNKCRCAFESHGLAMPPHGSPHAPLINLIEVSLTYSLTPTTLLLPKLTREILCN